MVWMKKTLLLIGAITLLSTAAPVLAADKWRIDDFATRDPEKLLMQSWDSPSFGLKVRIRSYLAEKHAGTAQGLFAQTWLQGLKKPADRVGGYEQCVAKYPKYQPCLYNLAADYTNEKRFEDALRLRYRLLEIDPTFFSGHVLLHAYSVLKHDLKRPAEADALLTKYRARLGDGYLWDYIAADDAKKANDLDRALSKYEAAVRHDDAPFEAWEALAELKSGDLFDSRKGDSRLDVATRVMSAYIGAGHREPRPIAYLRDNFKNALAGSADRQKLIDIEKQFSKVLAPEFIKYAAFNNYDLGLAADWVQENLPAPEANEVPYELYAWADAMIRTEGASPRVLSAYKRAIANAYTEEDRNTLFGSMLTANSEPGWCNPMAALAGELEARFATLKSPENRFELAVCNQDAVQAARELDRYADPASPTYRADWGRVAKLRAAEQNRSQYEREHPFLQNWFKQFGDRIELRIEFATGSAELPASATPDLNKLAALLKAPAAAGYVFEISGHTDNRGSVELNERLSRERAEAIVAALVRLGVPGDRLRSHGYAFSLPLASNQSEEGRARNRRVEVRPVGTLSAPTLAQKGNLPSGKIMPVAGGRWAIVGEGPSYLWDLQNNARLTEYAEGAPLFITKNGRYLITRLEVKQINGLDNRELLIYDIKSGKVVARRMLGLSNGYALSPRGDELAVSLKENVAVLSLPGLTTARIAPVASLSCLSKGMAWLNNGQIALSCANYPKIHVIDEKSLKTVRELDEVDWVHSLAATGDGRYLVAGNNGGRLYAWNTADWKLHGELRVPLGVPRTLLARPDSAEVSLAGNGKQALRIDIDAMRVIETWEESTPQAYSADGDTLFQLKSSGYALRNLTDGGVETLQPEAGNAGAHGVMTFPASNRMLISASDRTEIFDMTTFTRVYDLSPLHTSWRRISENLLQANKYSEGTWRRFDVDTLQLVGEGVFPNKELIKNYSDVWGENLVVVDQHDNTAGKPDLRATIHLLDIKGGGARQVEIELITGQLRIGAYQTRTEMALSPGNRWLIVLPSWQDGYGTAWVTSSKAYLIDTRTAKVVRTFSFNNPPAGFEFTGPDSVEFKFGNNGWVYNLPDGSDTKSSFGNETRLALGSDRIGLYQTNGNLYVMQGGKLRTMVDMRDRLSEAGYLPGPNLLVARLNNGDVQIHDGSSFALKFTIKMRGKGEWIAYTPDGYFSASLNGTDGLFWNVGEDYLPFDALREKFERPELIRQALTGGAAVPPAAVKKDNVGNMTNPDSVKPVQFEADAFSPPWDIRIDGAEERQTSAETEAVTVLIERKRAGNEPYQLRFTLNGRELKGAVGARGLKRVSACASPTGACEEKQVFNAELQPGVNIVQVSLGYKGMWLNPQTVIIQRQAAAPNRSAMLPRLWFFGVGVSDYAKSELNLKYPHADALALADMFKQQRGKLYSEVNIKVLTNAEATAQKLNVEMNRFLKGAAQHDLIVLFFAGHGILDNDQTLYFVSHDANPDEPYTGLNVSSIQELLNKRPQSQKALLWLDICHSGAAGERTRAAIGSDEALKLLAQGTGVKVMTSSTGREFSLEGPDYMNGHGAFTAALLEGLGGQADKKTGDGDGYVSVLELETFVARRVPETTKGKQHPTNAFSSKFQDYPVMRGQ